jgi:glycosyltransferase involved in cell wall biosynthesis
LKKALFVVPFLIKSTEKFVIDILKTDNEVLILIATFNGAEYLPQQIESIKNQSLIDWKLIIRDDSSTDGTVSIINSFADKDDRIFLLKDEYASTGSAQKNFSLLLQYAQTLDLKYVFLCDQDDVWLPNKLETLIDLAKKKDTDNLKPLLIHSDLEVVGANLQLISPSLVKSIGIKPDLMNNVSSLMFQNCVTGCSCMINRALLEKITLNPKNILMHDWWLALVASSVGEVIFIPEATVKYRQHGKNVVGALSYFALYNPFSKISQKTIRESSEFIQSCYEQIFNLRILLIKHNFETCEVDKLLSSAKLNRITRLVYLIKNNCLPSSKGRALGFIIRHLSTSSKRLKKYAK